MPESSVIYYRYYGFLRVTASRTEFHRLPDNRVFAFKFNANLVVEFYFSDFYFVDLASCNFMLEIRRHVER